MGFNFAGIVIDKNYDKDLNQLGEALKWGLEVAEEINFEQASANWTPEGELNIYFSDQATMIFFPHEWAIDDYHAKNVNSLCFAYSATSMAFYLSYQKEDGSQRSFMEMDGKKKLKNGEELPLEKEFPTADGLIFKLIDDLLGEPFGGIDLGAKAFRCHKIPYQSATSGIADTNENIPYTADKKWWEFWK